MKKRTLLGLLALAGAAPLRPALAISVSDATINKSAPYSSKVGENLKYNIDVLTNGPDNAYNVEMSDTLPAGTTFVSATQTGGPTASLTTPAVGAGGAVTATIPTLALNPVSDPQNLQAIGSDLYFSASDSAHGRELWKSFGTAQYTNLRKDINPGSGSSNPSSFTAASNGQDFNIFFTANDGTHGTELWAINQYEQISLVKDINTGASGSGIGNLVESGGYLYFTADDGVHGTELWKSDGTEEGTVLVQDIAPGSSSSNLSNLTDLNGSLLFTANNSSDGQELWKSDFDGTSLLKDINSGGGGSSPSNLISVYQPNNPFGNNLLFFTADDGTHGEELWRSDGTKEGTYLIKDILPDATGSSPTNLTSVNGTLYFQATDSENGAELWRSNGNEEGTYLVKDINVGGDSAPYNLTDVDGTLYFVATNGTSGYELWKSDGSEEGTVLVKDINVDGSSSLTNLTAFGNTLYFVANDGANGNELWKSDGTEDGTVLVKDIAFDGSSNPHYLTVGEDTLYFAANDGSGVELWKSDGTEAGTNPLRSAEIASFDIVVKLGESTLGTLSNTATVTTASSDPDDSNNSSTATTEVAENVKPQVSVLTPTNKQSLSINAFNSITGKATDNVGVTEVTLKLFRNRGGVLQYWNGETFGDTSTLLYAEIADYGSPSTTWSYPVSPELKSALDEGAYVVYAYAKDSAENQSGTFSRPFSLYSDDVKPVPSITTPTYRQTLSIAAFDGITGSATDNVGVTRVQFKLFRTVNGVVQYFNGTAFTPTPTLVPTHLSASGKKSTNWFYNFSPSQKSVLTPGSYLVYAYANDARNNQSSAVSRNFFLTGDDVKPSAPVISTPTQGQTLFTNNFISITGSATDNEGVTDVLLRLYRSRGGVVQYWNGTAFTPTATTFAATLNAPNSASTGWTYTVSPQLRAALDDGSYGIQAYGRDASGNQSAAASRTFKLIVQAPPAPKQDSAPQATGSSANDS